MLKPLFLLLFIFAFHSVHGHEKNSMRAERILNSVAYESTFHSIIEQNEWEELQLDRLLFILGRTETSFGNWALKELLHPIADHNELIRRQNIIKFLVEHEDFLFLLKEDLRIMAEVEKSVLAYWNSSDGLSRNCEQFFYSFSVCKYLNNSSLALNYGVMMQMFYSFTSLFKSLCLGGVYDEFSSWLYSEQEEFNIYRGIINGLRYPWNQHSFVLDVLRDSDKENYSFKDFMRAFLLGSLGDRYNMLMNGFNVDASTFGLSTRYRSYQKKADTVFEKLIFGGVALAPTILGDMKRAGDLSFVFKAIAFMNKILNKLQHRIVEMGIFFNTCKSVELKITQCLRHFAPKFAFDKDTAALVEHICAEEFSHKRTYWYSRGHVLQMHAELIQSKQSLISVLQSIAYVDAYCSIAQLYKELHNGSTSFCFSQFVEAQNPSVSYKDSWLALLSPKDAVVNDLLLGDLCPGKIIITGPNGGGKSTILKTFGIDAILAQSWTIVPASYAQQTIFGAIRTSFSPKESLSESLSTFMAEKKSMERLSAFIQESNQDCHMLMLIDEPYKGTVDDEAAKRIYTFGKNSIAYPYTLLCVATHVKKPIFLADETNGIFGNYHSVIRELFLGRFERLFKIKEGPAIWWFEDEDKRGRFIDWIGTKTGIFN